MLASCYCPQTQQPTHATPSPPAAQHARQAPINMSRLIAMQVVLVGYDQDCVGTLLANTGIW